MRSNNKTDIIYELDCKNNDNYINVLFEIVSNNDAYFLAYLLNKEFNFKLNRKIKEYKNKKGTFSYTCFCFDDKLERQEWFLFSNKSINSYTENSGKNILDFGTFKYNLLNNTNSDYFLLLRTLKNNYDKNKENTILSKILLLEKVIYSYIYK